MIFGASRSRRPRTPRSNRRTGGDPIPPQDLPPKLIPSVRQLFSTAASLAHTRFSLAILELEEEVQRLIRAAAYGSAAIVLVLLALVVATFAIVQATPEEHRVLAMVIIVVVYLAIASILGLQIKKIFTNRPPILGATLAELEKDRETLSQMARAHDAGEAELERARHEDAYAPPSRGATAAGGAR